MDDESLLERARTGDSGAFTVLVERYQDELYTMALRLLGAPADAADVVQETFLRAYMRLPELRAVSVRGWLYRVAVNASRDVQRRAVRRPADPLEDREGKVLELPSHDVGPEAAAEARARFEDHLPHCERCAAAAEEFRTAIDAVRALPAARMPVRVVLPATPPVAERRSWPPWLRVPRLGPAWGAGALAAAGIAAVVV